MASISSLQISTGIEAPPAVTLSNVGTWTLFALTWANISMISVGVASRWVDWLALIAFNSWVESCLMYGITAGAK